MFVRTSRKERNGGSMNKLKKILVLMFCFGIAMNLGIVANASGNAQYIDENDLLDVEVITREEYIISYAENHNISYEEAEQIDRLDNARIWNEYCENNNLPQPRDLLYENHYGEAGATIWYVSVHKEYDDTVTSFTYGSKGKVLQDTHSRSFVKNSFDGNSFLTPGSGLFTITNGWNIYIDDDSYSRVYMSVVCTSEIATSHVISVGGSGLLAQLGYSQGTSSYWRKTINANFTETL